MDLKLAEQTSDLFDYFMNPFNWDKHFYRFTRDEKDMNPYTINKGKDGSITIVHNVVGLDKKDLHLSTKVIDGKGWIIIDGQTKDEITGKTYSINSKFSCDVNQCDLDNIASVMRNGLLYITIMPKKKAEVKTKFITIS